MNLQNSLASGSLIEQPTSRNEIQELLKVASRWQLDANVDRLSLEGRFNSAYEAALRLAVVALRCAGYRTRGEGHHYVVFDVLPDIIGDEVRELSEYLQTCRKKRNTSAYHQASVVSLREVIELVAEVDDFERLIRRWLKENYPEFS
jgi:hypothetical protein